MKCFTCGDLCPDPEGPPLTASSTPLVGYKAAQLAFHGDTLMFRGISGGGFYLPEDKARCAQCDNPPNLDHRCGFNAYANRDDVYVTDRQALLTVELSGEVHKYERGFRAERQTVSRVEVARQCGHFVCDASAEGFLSVPKNSSRSVSLVDPACSDHATLTLKDVVSALGVPVELATTVRAGGLASAFMGQTSSPSRTGRLTVNLGLNTSEFDRALQDLEKKMSDASAKYLFPSAWQVAPEPKRSWWRRTLGS